MCWVPWHKHLIRDIKTKYTRHSRHHHTPIGAGGRPETTHAALSDQQEDIQLGAQPGDIQQVHRDTLPGNALHLQQDHGQLGDNHHDARPDHGQLEEVHHVAQHAQQKDYHLGRHPICCTTWFHQSGSAGYVVVAAQDMWCLIKQN